MGHGFVERFIHADGFGLSASERAFDTAGDACDAEVITEDGDSGLADALDEGFEIFELAIFLGSIEEDVVPEGGVKVFDGFQLEVMGFDGLAEAFKVIEGPEFIGVTGKAPAGVVTDGLVTGLVAVGGAEVVDQVNDEVGAAALFSEAEVVVIELVFIEAEAEFHGGSFMGFGWSFQVPSVLGSCVVRGLVCEAKVLGGLLARGDG
jgi:hypothetical protein